MRWYMVLIVCALLAPTETWAHRVTMFAYIDGSDVVAECGYSKSKRVRHGAIEVFDAASGELLVHTQTDEQGFVRFPLPEKIRNTGNGLRLVLKAGEGHQAEWIIQAEEYASVHVAHSTAQDSDLAANTSLAAQQGSAGDTDHSSAQQALHGLTRAELEDLFGAVLDAKLAPIKRALLEDNEPGLREIIGGIGWIFGLAGVAGYCLHRRRV